MSIVSAAAKLGRRVGRSIVFRTRRLLTRVDPRLLKRNIGFPLRNVLLGYKPLKLTAGGETFLLVPRGCVPLELWAGRYFERRELEFILNVLQPGMTFVDVGANVGLFSLPAARKVQSGRVFAFEPTSLTHQFLLENITLNKLGNLYAVHSALGDYTGEAVLQVNVPGKDGLNTLGRPTHEYSEISRTEAVAITTMDIFVRENSVKRVDVMKIDVEGAELLVLRGAQNLLKRADAPLILYEGEFLSKGFDYHPVEEMWFLERHGFHLFVIDSRTGQISHPPHGRAYGCTVIAVKPSHPAYADIKERAR